MVDLSYLSRLPNGALLDETTRLVQGERESTAAVIAALREIDERRLYLSEGHSSLFTYCTDAQHLSEAAAYKRIEVARISRAFPEVLAALTSGALNLSTALVIAPHLKSENVDELIARASFKRKRDVERLVAERNPKPDVPAIVRKQPDPRAVTDAKGQSAIALGEPQVPLAAPAPATVPAAALARPVIAPLSAARYKIQFTADQETHDKLRHAQALLRHQIPGGDLALIVNKALTLLIADVERTKLAIVQRPRASSKPPRRGSRTIPAAVRRAVWTRDEGRCAFVGRGGRCAERAPLEFHHVRPFADGGPATVENIELRCRAHNAHEAELYFEAEAVH